MKFRLQETYKPYLIAVIHIDDEDGTWAKIDTDNAELAADFLIGEMKRKHPEAKYIRVAIDGVTRTFGSYDALSEDLDDDGIMTPPQRYTSAATSINSAKLPAIFRLVKFNPNTVNLDYGGGRFDSATEALAQQNVTNLIYDPFNRTAMHNQMVLDTIRDNGGADTATCSNVLNVIAEENARQAVVRNIYKLLKNGGVAYFTVYEGDGLGSGRETPKGYQLNRTTDGYLEEIAGIFANPIRKGKLIIARK